MYAFAIKNKVCPSVPPKPLMLIVSSSMLIMLYKHDRSCHRYRATGWVTFPQVNYAAVKDAAF